MLPYVGKKEVFEEEIKLRLLRWGDSPGLSRWALNAITYGLIKGG